MRLNGLEILTTCYSVTTTSSGDSEKINELYTTLTSVSSTISTIAPFRLDINITNDYMSSLSDKQLVEMENKLQEKELVMVDEIDSPKVLRKR